MQLNVNQPKEWIAAFKIQATRDDQRLAEWVGECCVQFLDADLREGLVKRRPQGRPTVEKLSK